MNALVPEYPGLDKDKRRDLIRNIPDSLKLKGGRKPRTVNRKKFG